MYDNLYTTRLVMNLQGGDRSQCSLTCINHSYHMLCLHPNLVSNTGARKKILYSIIFFSYFFRMHLFWKFKN